MDGFGMKKIQLCCGDCRLEGWENYDREVDISKPLPFDSNSVNFIYLEHSIEHVTQKQAFGLLKDIHRVLLPGGVLRLCYPNIHQICAFNLASYNTFITGLEGGKPSDSIKDAIESQMYKFGHKTLWDEQLMIICLIGAGFDDKSILPCEINHSPHPDLQNIEQHWRLPQVGFFNSLIETSILEATK